MAPTINGAKAIPLRVMINPEEGEIVDVGTHRHRVIWKGGPASDITYCNNCGHSMVYGPEGGPDVCACGAPASQEDAERMATISNRDE